MGALNGCGSSTALSSWFRYTKSWMEAFERRVDYE